jgi:hypothetical protein
MASVNVLPGVPKIESPLFDRLFEDADPETLRIARALHEDGFALIDFPEPDFPALADAIIARLGPQMPLEAWRAGSASGPRTEGAWRDVPEVRQIATNPAILDLLGRLYGRRAFPFQTLNFPVGTQQHPHTDSAHFSSMPERFMCGVWVALEDIHADSGPLMYYPGSHRLPVFTNEHVGFAAHAAGTVPNQSVYEPMWRALVEAKGMKPAHFLPKRGQAVIWTANLLHGGSAQADLNRTRWSQVTHYYFEDCAYYTPMHSDPAFGQIAYRQVQDIATGKAVPNRYLGREVPTRHIAATRPAGSWAGGPIMGGMAPVAAPAGLVPRARRVVGRALRRLGLR